MSATVDCGNLPCLTQLISTSVAKKLICKTSAGTSCNNNSHSSSTVCSTNAITLSILCIPDVSHFHLLSSPCLLTESRNSSISTAGPLTHLQSPCSYRFIFTGQLPNLPASCTLAPHLYGWGLKKKPWMLQTQTGKFCWKKKSAQLYVAPRNTNSCLHQLESQVSKDII